MRVRFSRIRYRCIHCQTEFHGHESDYDRLCQECGLKDDDRLTIVEYLVIHDKHTYANNRQKLCEDVEGLTQEDIVRWIKQGRISITAGGGLRTTSTANDMSDQLRDRLDIVVAHNQAKAEETVEPTAPRGMATSDILAQLQNTADTVILERFQRGGGQSDSGTKV